MDDLGIAAHRFYDGQPSREGLSRVDKVILWPCVFSNVARVGFNTAAPDFWAGEFNGSRG